MYRHKHRYKIIDELVDDRFVSGVINFRCAHRACGQRAWLQSKTSRDLVNGRIAIDRVTAYHAIVFRPIGRGFARA